MDLEETIKEAILEFIYANYGEDEENACYNIEELSKAIMMKLIIRDLKRGIAI